MFDKVFGMIKSTTWGQVLQIKGKGMKQEDVNLDRISYIDS